MNTRANAIRRVRRAVEQARYAEPPEIITRETQMPR
jgi:hypothetical protein